MPYRHAHLWLLALFPLIVIAFWPNYFGDLGGARAAQHAHGITATLWLALLMGQSWSAHARRLAWHRASGMAVFASVPLFAGAGVWGVHDMAVRMAAGRPFEAAFGAALAPDDLVSIAALVGFVAAALAARRRVGRHSAWMLVTALLVLPPVTARLVQVAARTAGLEAPSMGMSFLVAHVVTIAVALVVAERRRADARPFLILVGLSLFKMASYPLLGSDDGWRAMLAAYSRSDPLPSVAAAAALSLAVLVWAWRTVPPRPRKAPRPLTASEAALGA